MTVFKYNGKKKNTTAFGYDFSNGPVDVPDTDKRTIKKLTGNGYFDKVIKKRKKKDDETE